MKEADIRTDDDLAYRWSLYRQDQRRLPENKDRFVEVPCPACCSSDADLYYMRDGFRFNQCTRCETVYVSPRPTREMLKNHYRNSLAEKYWNERVYPQTEQGRIAHLIEPRIERILDLLDRHGATYGGAIDVGGGSGTFAGQLLKRNLFDTVTVIEPDPAPAEICRRKGLAVIENFVEEITARNIASVITSFECVEHVFDPIAFVRNIHHMLVPKGLFIASTPSIKGFDLYLLKDKSDNTTAPDHLNYFHPRSFAALLEKCGFSVLEVLTPGKLDVELVRKKVLSGEFFLDDQPFLHRIVISGYDQYGESFQRWLSENCLSSHLWIVAQKQLR